MNPRTWVPKASTLPLDHRNRCLMTLRIDLGNCVPITINRISWRKSNPAVCSYFHCCFDSKSVNIKSLILGQRSKCQTFFVLWVRLKPVATGRHNYEPIHPLFFRYTPLTDPLLVHPSVFVTHFLYHLCVCMYVCVCVCHTLNLYPLKLVM